MAPIAAIVYASIQELAEVHATNVNQASADLLAAKTGHPDLVRVIHQTALLTVEMSRDISTSGDIRPTKLNIPQAAYDDIKHLAAANSTHAGAIAADLLALATGHPDQVRVLTDMNTAEVLPLAM
ncbi:hypothetical protein [Mycolicibacterium mucogenicum]|uniref:hypothetical protein n=2 Tax=Mycobacteriaceae TaxID=1762 RepID=UPI000AFB863E|nr:hypothetical protein [Mycolicibacterium mucogenicum]